MIFHLYKNAAFGKQNMSVNTILGLNNEIKSCCELELNDSADNREYETFHIFSLSVESCSIENPRVFSIENLDCHVPYHVLLA